MKTLMKTLIVALFLAAIACAQAPGYPFPDVWIWNYSGDVSRGGILAVGQGDGFTADAYTSNGIPIPGLPPPILPPYTWTTPWGRRIGTQFGITNNACHVPISYAISGTEVSYRGDGEYDHLYQVGLSFPAPPYSGDGAVISVYEAGSLVSNQPGGGWGGPYVVEDITGSCP